MLSLKKLRKLENPAGLIFPVFMGVTIPLLTFYVASKMNVTHYIPLSELLKIIIGSLITALVVIVQGYLWKQEKWLYRIVYGILIVYFCILLVLSSIGIWLFLLVLLSLIVLSTLYLSLLVSTIITYRNSLREEKENLFSVHAVNDIDYSFSEETERLIQSVEKFKELLIANEEDKREVSVLTLPHPKVDSQGKLVLEGFTDILQQCANVKPKERRSLLDYGKLKANWKAKTISVQEMATLMMDTPIYSEIAEGAKDVAHSLNIDDLIASTQEVGHEINEMVTGAVHDSLGETFADQVSNVHIPFASTLFEGYKQGRKLINGDIDIGDALAQSGSKIALKSAYGGVGAFVGSAFGPLGTIAGGFLGSYIGSLISNDIKSKKYNEMVEELQSYKDECESFFEDSKNQWIEAESGVALSIEKCSNKNEQQLNQLKNTSPLDKVDINIFYYSVCFVIKEFLVQTLVSNKRSVRPLTKYIPSNDIIRRDPQDCLLTLLYALELVGEKVPKSDYYNSSLIINQCRNQMIFDHANLQFTQERWIMDIYEEYYSSINDITQTFLDGRAELNSLYNKLEEDTKSREEELRHKLNETEKEKRRIK